ncbi:hypothetical protein BDZ89DRAFT_1036404 [Hymenopellis radicata]|nr:hypothetical protein BDZ89DRAFT_1036404 [Hymenopellis radicata]
MSNRRALSTPIQLLQYALGASLAFAHLQFFFTTTVFILSLSSSIAPVAGQVGPPTNATNLPIGTCLPDVPCANGACCNGKTGLCGFGDTFCTEVSKGGNCTSNCDALAECGDGSAPGQDKCPLNVCCSKFGFCGTTDDFCTNGCQSNCGQPTIPSCGVDEQTALQRRIGYYEGWANTRKCSSFSPQQIDGSTLTHVNFAFGLISSSFKIVEMTAGDSKLWSETTELKKGFPGLKVFLSIGGWTFNDPPTQSRFSDVASSAGNRATFGIDIDWEYPVADDRGGKPEDKANYVALMKLLHTSFKENNYGLSFTAPSSFWYLQNFDLPGMMENVDWVNLMSYDLHGTWDRNDTWIGPIVAAHTNLTEIDEALKLFWRAGVKPAQITLGLGFYGRSFTLDSASCNSPGCIWKSGGNAGPCSDNVGTLMWSEIQTILNGADANVVFDADAAVEMLTFGDKQWVSYDDEKTFKIKLNYANERCLGGTMIWSVDQDDSFDYAALKALYPSIADVNSGTHQGGDTCFTASAGAVSCGPGFSPVETAKDADGSKHLVCCPTGDMPTSCTWRGDGKRPCSPSCNDDEVLIATETCDSGGAKGLCCKTTINALENCQVGDCMDPDAVQFACLIEFPYLLTYDAGEPKSYCKGNKVRPICCREQPLTPTKPVENCAWVGTPPLCRDNFCKEGQLALIGDKKGDGDTACSGGKKRAYCCDAAGDSYSPVPWKDLFDTTDPSGEIDSLDGDAMTFTAEFDQDQDSGAGQFDSDDDDVGAGTTSDMPEDENENDEAFGEVFIDSPNANAVSSLDIQANWVITSCDARSDQPQVALAYCTKPGDPACSHVFIGGAENTIVQMPKSCGLGPYARVAALAPHANQSILYAHGDHQQRKRADEPVYELHFDYNFAVIPDDNGPVYMRADVTDMPDYWDTVVDSPPERREWRQKRGLPVGKPSLQKRWWGAFTKWLDKLNTVDSDNSVSRNFHWRDKWNIFHAERSCPGPPAYEASLDVTLKGKAKFDSRYGFYLQATIVPPTVKAAYLYVKADAAASATLTVEGMAKVSYDSSVVTFAQFGFPGLYYPGLLTIGPSLEINGYISGELSVQGTLDTSITYTMPSFNFALGKTSNDIGSTIQPSSKSQGFNMKAGYNVDMGGDIAIHIVPQVQFGVQILGGKLIDAEAFVRADMYAGLGINGSVSNTIAPKFCWDLYYGLDVQGGITGTLVYWDTGPHFWSFFSEEYSFYSTCFQSVSQPTTIQGRDEHLWHASAGVILDFDDAVLPSPYIDGAWLEHITNTEKNIILPRTGSGLSKRVDSTVPPLPGTCDCAAINDQINTQGEGTQCDPNDEVFDTWDEFNRRSFDDESEFSNSTDTWTRLRRSLLPRDTKSVEDVCSNPIVAAAYNLAAQNVFYDYANPTSAVGDASMTGLTARAPGSNSDSYGREHIYELQTIADFIKEFEEDPELQSLWDVAGQNVDFCTWVTNNIITNQVIVDLVNCLPRNQDRKYMPWLNSARVATIRSVAATLAYMNIPAVRQEYIRESNCVKRAWTSWLVQYRTQPGAPPVAATMNIGAIYQTWIKGVVGEFQGVLENSIQDLQTWWKGLVKVPVTTPPTAPEDVPVPVVFNYNQLTCSGKPTANQQITLSQLMNGGITPVMNANTLTNTLITSL